jgi:uncharacterized cupin superfamily protein
LHDFKNTANSTGRGARNRRFAAAGRATFVTADGQSFEFQTGDAAYFPPLTRGIWTIHETLRKTYRVWR